MIFAVCFRLTKCNFSYVFSMYQISKQKNLPKRQGDIASIIGRLFTDTKRAENLAEQIIRAKLAGYLVQVLLR